MSNQIPNHNKLNNLNSDSNLPNAEFVERQLLHSVFANPVVHRGSNDHMFPRWVSFLISYVQHDT